MLRTPRTLREIKEIKRTSEQPEALAGLVHIIEEELGFHLYQAVNQTKLGLSEGTGDVIGTDRRQHRRKNGDKGLHDRRHLTGSCRAEDVRTALWCWASRSWRRVFIGRRRSGTSSSS